MIATTLAALLQFGSCQASPDWSRTAAEAADILLKGIEDRDETALWWVVRPGAIFTIDGTPYSDKAFYVSLQADISARQNLIVVRLDSTPSTVTVTTAYGNYPNVETQITLRFSEGCITAVNVRH